MGILEARLLLWRENKIVMQPFCQEEKRVFVAESNLYFMVEAQTLSLFPTIDFQHLEST